MTALASQAGQLSEFLCSTIALVCNRLDSEVSPATSFLELRMDSLTFVSVLAQIEAVYDVEFQSNEMLDFLSADRVGELSRKISRVITDLQPR